MGQESELDELRAQIAAVQEKVEKLSKRAGKDELAVAARDIVDTTDFLKALYQERRLRDDLFQDPDLFGEPAWDILLDLAMHEGQGRQVSITGACIGSGVPLTTALRWITVLEQKGLIERQPDALDQRRTFVSLTSQARAHLRNYVKRSAVLRKKSPTSQDGK